MGATFRTGPARAPTRFAVLLSLLVLFLWAGGRAWAGNPDRRWRTITTEHFHIHYAAGQEEFAARTAVAAERAYRELALDWGHPVRQRIHVVVTDATDFANGRATVTPFPRVILNVTAPESMSVLDTYDDWIDILVTHELVHIVHLDTIHGLPRLVNALFGFGVLGNLVSPNVAQPRWFVEGVATYEESDNTSAGRGRSALFDMYLRMPALEGRLQTIDQVSSGARIWPHGSSVYLYGLHFMRYIAERYGADKLRELSHVYGGQAVPLGINRALEKVLGVDYHTLWQEFRRDTERRFRAQARRVRARGLRDGRRLTFSGQTVRYPTFEPDGRHVLYFASDGHRLAEIRRVSLRGSVVREGVGIGREGTSVGEEPVLQVQGLTRVARTPQGIVLSRVAAVDLRYDWSDLYLWRFGDDPRSFRRLTFGRRASEPHVGRDGRTVVFRRNDSAQSRVGFLDLRTGEVTELAARARIEQITTPTLSPDGRYVAFSAFAEGGYRDIVLYDRKTGSYEHVTADRFSDISPTFSPDGRYVVFSSDRDGIFNVHAYDLRTRRLYQVTNVYGGAFEPTLSPDGRTLVYVGFTSDGFDLWTMPFDPLDFLPAVPAGTVVPRARPTAPTSDATRGARVYRPSETFFPRVLFPSAFDFQTSAFANEIGAQLGIADVLGFHALNLRFAYLLPPVDQPVGSVSYTYDRLLPTFRFEVARAYALRSGFRRYVYDAPGETADTFGAYVQEGYRESIWTASAVMGVPLVIDPRYRVQTSVGYRFTHLDNLDADTFEADPNAPLPRLPETGNLGQADLRLSFSSERAVQFGYGGVYGTTVSATMSILDRVLGSDYGDLQARFSLTQNVPMPWRGHQVLALRGSAGASAGGLRRRGAFFVGGPPEYQDVFRSLLARTPVGTGGLVRGYRPGVVGGRYFFVANAEYRIPILDAERGLGTLPAFLRSLTFIPYADAGRAFSGPLAFGDVLWGVGASFVMNFRVGYVETISLFFDYAHGFDDELGLDQFRVMVARSF